MDDIVVDKRQDKKMKPLYYKVAGLSLTLSVEDGFCPERMLPSFVPFVDEGRRSSLADGSHAASLAEGSPALTVVQTSGLEMPSDAQLLITETNDMGRTSIYMSEEGYFFSFEFMQTRASMLLKRDFRIAKVDIDLSMLHAGHLLSSVVRTAFAQSVVACDGISLHASCVILDGRGYLFMGKSGTGKSTHSRLWLDNFSGAELLNDDNPIVRLVPVSDTSPANSRTSDASSVGAVTAMVYGSPWSGKTDCYRQACVPVGGIVRLSQAPKNSFEPKSDVAAFLEIYPGCSVLRNDPVLHDRVCDSLETLTAAVPVGHLNCRPDLAAAILCRDSLRR